MLVSTKFITTLHLKYLLF